MSQMTVEDLLDELLLEIFNYLDAKSLKKCCETSKRFNDIISSNKSTMKKLPLFISEENQTAIKTLSRKYHTVIFDNLTISQKLVNELFKQHVFSSVKVLELIDVFINQAELQKIFKKLRKTLEKILIVDSKLLLFKKRNLIDIPLRKLIFIQSSFEFLEFIGKSLIEELKIHHNAYSNSNSNDEEILEEFLMRTSSIQSLAVRVHPGTIYETLLNDDEKEYSFKLSKLSVTYNSFGLGTSADENFLELLKQHDSTLEHMEVDCKLTDDTYEYIFEKLKLKSLRIDGSKLPDRCLFFHSILPNNHLKKLYVTKEFSQQASASLFKIFKSIQDLTITQWTQEMSNEFLISIASNLSQLKSLNIPDVPDNPTEISMPSLQSLRIECIQGAANFRTFVSRHVNLKELLVKWVLQELTFETMSAITSQLTNLESLSFGPTFKPTLRLYDTISRNAENLRVINIFRFPDETMDEALESHEKIKTYYFTNKSSPLIFKMEFGMWDEEDMVFPFSSNDLVPEQSNVNVDLNSDDSEGLDDEDDEDMDYYDENNEGDIDMMMYGGVLGMLGFY